MSKTLLKTMALALSVACVMFSACTTSGNNSSSSSSSGGTTPVIEKETIPDYYRNKGENNFIVGMWSGIAENKTYVDEFYRVTGTAAWTDAEFDNQYKLIKEAGFTLAATPIGLFSNDHIIRLLESAEKYELKQLVWDSALNNILMDSSLSEENAVVKARRAVVDYIDYDSFYGNMITDEPNSKEFDALARAAKIYKKAFPDKMFYLNLYPVLATPLQTGEDDYTEYLRKYESLGLDYVCYDNYPLKRGTGGTTVLKDNFVYNMQLANAMQTKPKVWSFLQSMGFGGMKEPDCVEDFRIQLNIALANGQSAIQWFCYFSPGYGGSENFTPAIIMMDGTPTEKYDYVKTVNNEIAAWGDIYSRFAFKKSMNVVGSENQKGENAAFNYIKTDNSHDRIKSLSVSKDTIIGVFKDDENRDGFMVTNYDIPSSKQVSKVEICFHGCTKAIVIKNGVKSLIDVSDGKVSLDLKASEGAFVIPLNI